MIQIIWMHSGKPTFSPLLLHSATCKISPALIKKGAQFIRTGHPDQNRCVVCHSPKTLFAFPENLVCTFALGSVLDESRRSAKQPSGHVAKCSDSASREHIAEPGVQIWSIPRLAIRTVFHWLATEIKSSWG